MNNPLSIEAQQIIKKLEAENKLMRQLATATGFFEYYFSMLKHYRTNLECFNAINDLYFDIFGEYKYSSHKSFHNQKSKYLTR